MKKIFFLLLISVCSCSKSDPTVYTSLVGHWRFTTKSVAAMGDFKISSVSNILVVDNDYGQFTINSKKYAIDTRQKMEIGTTPRTFSHFWLIDTDTKHQIVFDNSEYNNDFTKITAKSFYVVNGITSQSYNEVVVIIRE